MRRGFSLMELMVVLALFTLLFASVLGILTISDRSWNIGHNKLTEQQEARKAMDDIARLLRQSNPQWDINGTLYPATISELSKRIDFYQPVFDATGAIASLRKITFKIDPGNSRQLLKKEGSDAAVPVTGELEDINFGGGCAGCAAFNCATVADDCPVVDIQVKTKKNADFDLVSQITLRNQNVVLDTGVTVEEPQEGEF